MYERWEIAGHVVEFISEDHLYICDGIILPSITTMLKMRFGGKYTAVAPDVLNAAANAGTIMHKAIQDYEEQGIESDLKEVRNYKFLKSRYKWECLKNEVPVILFQGDPIACGRIDMVGTIDGNQALFDFKRTSQLDKEYLGYQLNLYRIAYQQSYGGEITVLKGIHLRDDTRKLVDIKINEPMTWDLVIEYQEAESYINELNERRKGK